MKARQLLLPTLLVAAVGVAIQTRADDASVTRPPARPALRLSVEADLPSLGGATEWLNSKPLSASSLRGKVVLVAFWTYSCINWRRSLPYIRAWADKYRDQGLVVIGVHTPEFSFEKNVANVRSAAKHMEIDYPIALDALHGIWRAFGNEYWPALYFVDGEGRIRHHHFGEGNYAQSERVIQQLLREAGHPEAGGELVSVEGRGVEAAADWASVRSPENYLGYDRTERFASPGGSALNERRRYVVPTRLGLNQWALLGDWAMQRESIILKGSSGRIAYGFHARDLHVVMGPAAPGGSVRFRVLIDGRPPGAAHGVDIDEQGNGTVSEQRLYQLIRQPKPVTERRFDIEFIDGGVEAFSFTFG